MKKLIILFILGSGLLVSCYDDSALIERIDALEKNAIASINEQISAIKASITSLEDVNKEVKTTIQILETNDGSLEKSIDELNSIVQKLQSQDELFLDDINSLKSAIKAIEDTNQIFQADLVSIKKLLEDLANKDTILKNDITNLIISIEDIWTQLKNILEDIVKLKEADTSLEKQISELKTYVNDEISNMENWANATFATLEKYDSLCVVLVGIETAIADLEEEFTQALADAIADSEKSIKGWVNEQLTGYWTIAETQARIDSLKQTQNEDITKLTADLKSTKKDMTDAYTSAISTAIEDLEGKLSDEITKINENLEKRIDDIEDRLSAIEETLNHITRDFAIAFDDYDIGILAGGTASVGYTITGATEKTIVKALCQNGWSAKVTPDGAGKGEITVTAPNPMTDDEIIVLVYDGEYRTVMSSINFVTGVVTPSRVAVEVGPEAGNFEIMVASNLIYDITISEDAKDWLTIVETKSMTENTVKFAYDDNRGNLRQGQIYFTDSHGKAISSILILQTGMSDVVIPVSTVSINRGSVTLYVGYGAQLTASVMPRDATDKTVTWSSDCPNVASVDANGLVTAISPGIATIIATSGEVSDKCSITVSDIQVLNYIDEYGIDQGKGVVIGNAIWAPVNCGYHPRYYKYGKLYQWGRKYGQGYDESDATQPILETGGVSIISGNIINNTNVFYTGTYENNYSWVYPGSTKFWNEGDYSNPIKAEYDPCPVGWRVPTNEELSDLGVNCSEIITDEMGRTGLFVSGPNTYSSYTPHIFLPFAGSRWSHGEISGKRNIEGVYWSSTYYSSGSRVLNINSNGVEVYILGYQYQWANGHSVRCVQE